MRQTPTAGEPFRLETVRLSIRELTRDDAPWILALVTDPDWLRFIGDRGVATVEQAAGYVEKGPIASYALEAARACLDYGWQVAGLKRIVAITSPGNDRSTRLLERLGFRFERALELPGDDQPTHLWAASCPD